MEHSCFTVAGLVSAVEWSDLAICTRASPSSWASTPPPTPLGHRRELGRAELGRLSGPAPAPADSGFPLVACGCQLLALSSFSALWCQRVCPTSASLPLPCKEVFLYHFSRFHIRALTHIICFPLSDLLHSVCWALGPFLLHLGMLMFLSRAESCSTHSFKAPRGAPQVAPEFGMTTNLQPALWRRECRVFHRVENTRPSCDRYASYPYMPPTSYLDSLNSKREKIGLLKS